MDRKQLIFAMASILLAANANKDNAPDRKFVAEEARLLLVACTETFSSVTPDIALSVAIIYANIIRSNPTASDPAQRHNAIAWAKELLHVAAEAAIKK